MDGGCLSCCNGMYVVGCYMYKARLCEAASLVIGCAVDPTLFCGLLYLSFELLI